MVNNDNNKNKTIDKDSNSNQQTLSNVNATEITTSNNDIDYIETYDQEALINSSLKEEEDEEFRILKAQNNLNTNRQIEDTFSAYKKKHTSSDKLRSSRSNYSELDDNESPNLSDSRSFKSRRHLPPDIRKPLSEEFKAKQEQRNASAWENASLISRYFLLFMYPLFFKSRKTNLNATDLDGPPKTDKAASLASKLERNWTLELASSARKDRKPSFARAMWATFGSQFALHTFIACIFEIVLLPIVTIALGWLIRDAKKYDNILSQQQQQQQITTISNNNTNATATLNLPQASINEFASSTYTSIVYDSLTMLAFILISSFMTQPYFFSIARVGMRMRISVCQLVFRKALRLNQSALQKTTVGQMVNLMSSDVNRFDTASPTLPYIIVAPLQALVVMFILSYFYIGWLPTLACVLTIIVYVTGQTLMGRGFLKFRARTATRSDERIRLMNEIINAAKVVKMYAWEKPFSLFVHDARKLEVRSIASTSILRAVNISLFYISSKIISFAALMTYIALGNPFDAEIVFVAIGLSMNIRVALTLFFPNAIANFAETLILCRRATNFLTLPENDANSKNYKHNLNWPPTTQTTTTTTTTIRGNSKIVSSNDDKSDFSISFDKVFVSYTLTADDLPQNAKLTSSSSQLLMSSQSLKQRSQHMIEETAAQFVGHKFVLRNLSFVLYPRDLLVIVGRVGAGKSSVLNAMIGELPVTQGLVHMNGRISYACQDAWIFSGTVRDNILFGLKFKHARYWSVIKVCSLSKDLDLLIDGDMTIVGDKGVSLSGGQKARVNLARALYREADIYLLDDPLSAVDAPVAKHIVEKCLQDFLKDKTVVLVTHQLQSLRFATKVLVVGGPECPASFGTVEQIMQSKSFSALNYGKAAFEDATSSISKSTTPSASSAASNSSSEDNSTIPLSSLKSTKQLTSNSTSINESQSALSSSSKQRAAIQVSTKKKVVLKGSSLRSGTEILGAISSNWSTYSYYFHNMGIVLCLLVLALTLFSQFLYQWIDQYLSLWTDSEQRAQAEGENFVKKTFVDYMSRTDISIGYAIFVAMLAIFSLLRFIIFFVGALRASVNIHNKLFRSIICAPMNFFDFRPIGVLLARFSSDINQVDDVIPLIVAEVVLIFTNIGGILILTVIINPTFSPAVIVLAIVCISINRFATKAVCRLKQIEGSARSPLYSHISTTISGLSTIRASNAQESMLEKFELYQNLHTKVYFYVIASGRWLSVTSEWLLIVYEILLLIIILSNAIDTNSASDIGLLFSQTLAIQGGFQYSMRQLIELESQMTSLQRIKDFSFVESEDKSLLEDKIESVSSFVVSKTTNNESPYNATADENLVGKVEFKSVTLKYLADEDPVLREVSFKINPGEKVGVVGRTGAGKSSLISVLFRLYEFDGSILVNGVDSKTMPLGQLRASMSIIPQDPILFGATLRKNLDPIGEHDDEKLWKALEIVQLKDTCSTLDFRVSEAGTNFSVGQRQLICLARAILRRNKILMLDEATANVDPETDSYIQKIIATEFASCTVITIAHRLITIAGADKVLVMDAGRAVEFASPAELASNKQSLFSQMIDTAYDADRIREKISR